MACAASPTRSGSARNSPSAASASGSSCRPRAAIAALRSARSDDTRTRAASAPMTSLPVTRVEAPPSRTPPSHRPRSAAALRAPYRRLRDRGAHEPQPPAPSRRGHVPRPRRLVCHVCRRAWRARGGPPPEPWCREIGSPQGACLLPSDRRLRRIARSRRASMRREGRPRRLETSRARAGKLSVPDPSSLAARTSRSNACSSRVSARASAAVSRASSMRPRRSASGVDDRTSEAEREEAPACGALSVTSASARATAGSAANGARALVVASKTLAFERPAPCGSWSSRTSSATASGEPRPAARSIPRSVSALAVVASTTSPPCNSRRAASTPKCSRSARDDAQLDAGSCSVVAGSAAASRLAVTLNSPAIRAWPKRRLLLMAGGYPDARK